jgi:uncharacterized membrane protein
MGIVIFWLLLAIAVGIWASNRGRNGFVWFLLACIASPLVAGIFLAVSANKAKVPQQQSGPSEATHIRCHVCAEFVLPQALKCKHCDAELKPDPQFEQRVVTQQTATKNEDSKNLFIGIGFIVALIVVVNVISWAVDAIARL